MSKSNQVQAEHPEQVQPEIPGQMTMEEVLNTTNQVRETRPPRNRSKTAQTGASRTRSSKNTRTGTQAGATPQKSASRAGTSDQTGADKTEQGKSGANQVRRLGERGKDKVPRKKRTDFNLSKQVPADERQQIVRYNMEMFMLGKLKDPNDIEEVRERIRNYFIISDKYQQAPTVAGLALALGIDRRTLWTWMERKNGVIKNPDVMDTLKNVYNMITAQYESLLTQNKIVPVAGFFLMQNNFGYKNQTDHVVVAQQAEEPDTGDIAARAGLLDGEDN